MEVRSDRGLSIPRWVVMDHQIFRRDLVSIRRDDRLTSAMARASNGDPVRVSFILSALPGTSRLCVRRPEVRDLSCFDTVVAAHGDAVLFRLLGDFPGLTTCLAIDFFLYRARPSGPELSLLPRHYSTQKEIAAAAEGSWRRSPRQRMVNTRGIGLLLVAGGDEDPEGFVVAELRLKIEKLDGEMDAPLEGELFRLRSGGGEWEAKHASVRNCKATFRDIHGWWEAHRVVSYGRRYLCWVDLSRGVVFCDVNSDSPELQYLPLPVGHVPQGYPDPFHSELPQAFRAVCVSKQGECETMKFVNVVHSDGFEPGSSFTIAVWTLAHGGDGDGDMEWMSGVAIEAHELWAMEGYDDDQLPRSVPLFPLVSMDSPNIIYFVLRERRSLDAGAETWVVTLDMDSKTILSYGEIKAIPEKDPEMASYNIFLNAPFFPSEFCKYFQKTT